MVNNNTLEELVEVFRGYNKGKYIFGKYGTGEQIERAFLGGKIFVLKGPKSVFLIPLIFVPIFAVYLLYFFPVEEELFIPILIMKSIAISFLGFFFIIFSITFIRHFVVIGPLGFYYRRVFKKGCFHWKDVILAQASIHTTKGGYRRPTVTLGRVEIILHNGRKIRFESGRYRKKEFPSGREVKRLMFIRLFKIYYELGKR